MLRATEIKSITYSPKEYGFFLSEINDQDSILPRKHVRTHVVCTGAMFRFTSLNFVCSFVFLFVCLFLFCFWPFLLFSCTFCSYFCTYFVSGSFVFHSLRGVLLTKGNCRSNISVHSFSTRIVVHGT